LSGSLGRKTYFSATAIADWISKLEADPQWTGTRQAGSGPPRKTIEKQDEALLAFVFKLRGKKKVTVNYLRTSLGWAKKLGNAALKERLHDVVWHI
jgi:hypothetical protein